MSQTDEGSDVENKQESENESIPENDVISEEKIEKEDDEKGKVKTEKKSLSSEEKRKAYQDKKKMDYKNVFITNLAKVLKKIKAFTIRKLLRNIKEIEEGAERKHILKESKEERIMI